MQQETNQAQQAQTLQDNLYVIQQNKSLYLESLLTITTEFVRESHAYSREQVEQAAHTVGVLTQIVVNA